MSKIFAIIPAAGRGLRMGGSKPKQFLELSGKSLLSHTLDTFCRAPFLTGLLLVVPEDFMADARALIQGRCCSGPGNAPLTVVQGGAERQDSVFNGLEHLPPDCEWVMVHDGVRPFVSAKLLEETWKAARKTGAAIAALPATDTVKRVGKEHVLETLPREEIWLVQTPQVFKREVLEKAYGEARRNGWLGTDDASFVERMGIPVTVVHGERSNIKVTTPEDLDWGAWYLCRASKGVNGKAAGGCGCE